MWFLGVEAHWASDYRLWMVYWTVDDWRVGGDSRCSERSAGSAVREEKEDPTKLHTANKQVAHSRDILAGQRNGFRCVKGSRSGS